MEKEIKSVLNLTKLVFDKINFNRVGFSSDKEFEFGISSSISQRKGTDIYKVTLYLNGFKPEEYVLDISLSGYFTITKDDNVTDDIINSLISKNAVAILMPYLRSEVSLLTAQPGMESVTLPVFNVNNMVERQKNDI